MKKHTSRECVQALVPLLLLTLNACEGDRGLVTSSHYDNDAAADGSPIDLVPGQASASDVAPVATQDARGVLADRGPTTGTFRYTSSGFSEPLVATFVVAANGDLSGEVCGPIPGTGAGRNCGSMTSAWIGGALFHFDFILPWPGGGELQSYSLIAPGFSPGMTSFSALLMTSTEISTESSGVTWHLCPGEGVCPEEARWGKTVPLAPGRWISGDFEDPFSMQLTDDGRGGLSGSVCGAYGSSPNPTCVPVLNGRRRGSVIGFEFVFEKDGFSFRFDGVIAPGGKSVAGRLVGTGGSVAKGGVLLSWRPCPGEGFKNPCPTPKRPPVAIEGQWEMAGSTPPLMVTIESPAKFDGTITGTICRPDTCAPLMGSAVHDRRVTLATNGSNGFPSFSGFAGARNESISGWLSDGRPATFMKAK